MSLDYPTDRIEILCGSDGSTDQTNRILSDFASLHTNFRLFLFATQRGKMMILNDLVAEASGEILLFVDADVTLSPGAVRRHVSHYSVEIVGGVAGRLRLVSDAEGSVFESESMFLKHERQLRTNEARLWSTVGLYGGNYSLRRALWKALPNSRVYDDFHSVLHILQSGKRLVYDDSAVATEPYSRTYRDEFNRKTRNASRCLYTLSFFPSLLLKPKSAFFLWPHKILRWFAGYLFLGLFIGTSILFFGGEHSQFISLLFISESGAILLAALGWLSPQMPIAIPFASSLFWYSLMNLAFMKGVYEFVFFKQEIIWTQTTRFAGGDKVKLSDSESIIH